VSGDDRERALHDVVSAFDTLVDTVKDALRVERDLHHRVYLEERLLLLRAARDAAYANHRHRVPLDLHVPGQMSLDGDR
jgi:hypothetical protein